MQMHHLQTLYPRFQIALAEFPDTTTSLCLYESLDRERFHAFSQPGFGFPTSTFPTVLPELKTRFAVQATGAFIRAAIDSATIMMLHEIDIGCGHSIRVFDDASQLASAAGHCQASAFVRADACLVVWADSVDSVLFLWNDITSCLQRQFGGALLPSNPMAGLSGNSYGDSLGIDQFLHSNHFDVYAPLEGGSSQLSNDELSSLGEFSFLATVHPPTTPSPTHDTYHYDPAWFWDQSESPGMGVLQHGLQMLNTSEPSLANDVSSYSFDDIPLTVNLASISPPPAGVFDLSQEEDPTTSASASSCGLSLDFASDGALSPAASFSQSMSPGAQQDSFVFSTGDAISFRRHSVGGTSAPERMVGMKTKRDSDGWDNDDSYFPTPADVAHTSKRRRADGGAIVKATPTSAPARFTVPLPDIGLVLTHEKNDSDDYYDDSSSSSQSIALSTPASTSASLVLSPAPTPTPAPVPATATAPQKGRRRAGTSGGRARRIPRTKCDYCPKTFSRMQDAQRHAERSCPDNPYRTGVPCPECGEVLSRLDSAQRHWRGHENPQCEPPEWVH